MTTNDKSQVAPAAKQAQTGSEKRGLRGRDLINIGIFTAIYFVLNFICMLLGGFHPALWVFMPALIALVAGIPYMLMCAKVQKPGAVLIMGVITALIYFVTGMFTPFILLLMIACCVIAEVVRAATKYESFWGNALSYAVFGLGMCGSPLPIWTMRDAFFEQIQSQGMSAEYVGTLAAITGDVMLPVMVVATFACGFVGALIARALFRKHFEKAGLV